MNPEGIMPSGFFYRGGKIMYYLGIDGGGTKTTCLVCDENLSEIFRTVGSSINFYSEGLDRARENMKAMLSDIENNTGISRFDGVCIGSSALFGRADEKTKSDFCDGVFHADSIIMDSDLFIALKATGRKNAAVVIAGTGSMAAGFNGKGEIITKGGYGYILGDEGSGYRIALDGIREGVRSLDNTGMHSLLGEYLLDFAGVNTKEELVDAFYSPEKDRKSIAAFAPFVSKAAKKGDATARKILTEQGELLYYTVKALLSEMPERPHIALYGGVFQHDEIYTSYFRNALSDFCSECELLEKEPVFGAVLAAKELCENDN
ncbi:MAG: hypothetical protein E7573_02570 [Ruminococcaceae bacterium]|nr:hypothetical protein [Oscillospiraceae bacterium]